MTILLLTQMFPPRRGGSGRWLWELYRRLTGVGVHVLAGVADGAESFDRSAPLAISRMPLDFANWGLMADGLRYFGRLRELEQIVARVRPDAVHCGKCLPEGLLAAMLKLRSGLPFVVYCHGEELMLAAASRELRFLTRRVLKAADRVIANSQHTKRLLGTTWGVPERRISVMHPGVDTATFVAVDQNQEIRRRLGWSGRRVVLTVGALQKRKGQDMMIQALPGIRSRCPDVLFSMVGEGWEQPYLEQLVGEYGVRDAVEFRGPLAEHELLECYQQCDVFALPNRQVGWDFEGFGIALIEAQSCARPVIAGLSGGAPETVLPNESGLVMACETPQRLADAVVSLLEDPRRREAMGRCARQWVAQHFDWSVLVPQAQALFVTA